jgi:hypothetical protein
MSQPTPPRKGMGFTPEHRNEMSEPLAASQLDARTQQRARMERDAPHRIRGNARAPHRLGRKLDAPQSIGVKCQNADCVPTRCQNHSLTHGWKGMLLIASKGNVTIPHRRGRTWDAPQSIGMDRRNPSLRPNEVLEVLAAAKWDGFLHIAWDGKCNNPTPPREEMGCPQSIGVKCQNPSLRPNAMSELPTAPE